MKIIFRVAMALPFFAFAACNNSAPASHSDPDPSENPTPVEFKPTVKGDFSDTLYIGAKNPITISGVPTEHLVLESGSFSLFTEITPTGEPGKFLVSLKSKDKNYSFRVHDTLAKQSIELTMPTQLLPIPEVLLGDKYTGGDIKAAEFSKQTQLSLKQNNMELETDCMISSYEFIYKPKGQDDILIMGINSGMLPQARRAMESARAGDTYTFKRIKVTCSGYVVPQSIPSELVFSIK